MSFEPPQFDLTHDDMAAIGLIAMLEARAKSFALAALKGAAGLSSQQWQGLERCQFKQVVERLISSSQSLDQTLHQTAQKLQTLREVSQDDRHKIIHAAWGRSPGNEPVAYDTKRKSWLSRSDIEHAITSNKATDRVAHECLWRTAQLVEKGVIPARSRGAGPAMRLNSGLWQW